MTTIATVCQRVNGSTVDSQSYASAVPNTAVCHGADEPTVSCPEAGGWPGARIHNNGNRCIKTRPIRFGGGAVRGTAQLPLVGAYVAREAVTIIGLNAAGAISIARRLQTSFVARCLRSRATNDLVSSFALNKLGTGACAVIDVGLLAGIVERLVTAPCVVVVIPVDDVLYWELIVVHAG